MVQSNNYPKPIYLQKIENSTVHLQVRWDIIKTDINDENGKRVEYNYNEREIVIQIPVDVVTPVDLKAWIAQNAKAWIGDAKMIIEPQTTKIDDVRTMDIAIVRMQIDSEKRL